MATQHKSTTTSFLVSLVTIFLLSITVLAQENCKKDSVEKSLRFWTNGAVGHKACQTEQVQKLIEYYKDISKSKRANGKCRQTILIEARKLIVNQVAEVLEKAVTEPEKAKEWPAMMQQLDGDDGLLESVINTAYWNLAKVNKTKLTTVITKAGDDQQKLRGLIELDRLASANGEAASVEEIKTAISQVEKLPIAQSEDKIKNMLTLYKKKNGCINEKPMFSVNYPPWELKESIHNLATLQKSCKPLSQRLVDLEKKSTDTWIRCYAKMNNSLNARAKVVKNKVLLLDTTLKSLENSCKKMQFSNYDNEAANFQNVLNDISYVC